MVTAAARLDGRLLDALTQLDARGRPIAETHRQLGALASELGLARPSYERVRVLVHELRALQPQRRDPSLGRVLVDVAFRARPPEAVLDHIDRRIP
jgi:hypothetical protein